MKVKELLKNKKIMMTAAVVIVVIVIVIIVRRRKKAEKADKSSGYVRAEVVADMSALPVASFPLTPYSMAGEYSAAKGSYGQQVAALQKGLNQKYNCNLTVDGKFGPKTTQALCDNILCPEENSYTQDVYMSIISQFPI